MQSLVAVYDGILKALGLLPGLLVATIGIGTCADVLLRNLGFSGLFGMTDIVEYCLLLLPMVGAGYIMRINRHVTVDIVPDQLPPAVARRLLIVTTFVGAVFSAVFLWLGIRAVLDAYQSDSLIQKAFIVPEWLALLTIVVGFLFLTIELIRRVYLLITTRNFHQSTGTGRDGGLQ